MVSLFTLVLGITAVAGEYRHRTITSTYLATPHRGRVIAAKLAVYTGVGVAFGIVNAATALASTAIWYAGKDASLDLTTVQVWRNILGGVAWNTAFAAIGVGALVRNPAAAVTAALLWIALVEGIVSQLLGSLGRWLPFAARPGAGQHGARQRVASPVGRRAGPAGLCRGVRHPGRVHHRPPRRHLAAALVEPGPRDNGLESLEANKSAGQQHEREPPLRVPLPAHPKAPVARQPRQRPLDLPPLPPQPL
jgi:hypothetical protein